MAAFEYTALDAQGRELRGVLEGDSARQIRQLLRDQALLPVTVNEVNDTPTRKSFSFSFAGNITDGSNLKVPMPWSVTCLLMYKC